MSDVGRHKAFIMETESKLEQAGSVTLDEVESVKTEFEDQGQEIKEPLFKKEEQPKNDNEKTQEQDSVTVEQKVVEAQGIENQQESLHLDLVKEQKLEQDSLESSLFEEVQLHISKAKEAKNADGTIDALALIFDRLLPKKRIQNNILLDEDLISREKSIQRLEWLMVLSAFVLCSVALGMSINLAIETKKPRIIIPKVEEQQSPYWRTFPTLHLALIDSNALVHDFSFKPAISASREKLIKLPLPSRYLGYSDDKGVLYFMDGRIGGKDKVTMFHPALNKNGHKTIPRKWRFLQAYPDSDEYMFAKSTLIGPYFWLYSCEPQFYLPEQGNNILPYSNLWHILKEAAFPGPKLFSYSGQESPVIQVDAKICSTALNSSHVMIIGFKEIMQAQEQNWIMNFETNKKESIKSIGIDFFFCMATTIFDKEGHRSVFVLLELHPQSAFASYDLDETGRWTVHEMLTLFSNMAPHIIYCGTFEGTVFIVENSGGLKTLNPEGHWQDIQWTSNVTLKTVIPYYA